MIQRGGKLEQLLSGGIKKTESLNYGRDIVQKWATGYAAKLDSAHDLKILDLGIGPGTDISNIANALSSRRAGLFGIDFFSPNLEKLKGSGITLYKANIEKDPIPAPDEEFDIIIANQILEHTKEIFWIFGEISRVLKKGGILIAGVPNLASFHNRILLLGGENPTSIEILGPHVRGFTKPSFRRFVETQGYFKLMEVKGANFYPFPPRISKVLSRLFPTLSAYCFFLVRRTAKPGNYLSVLKSSSFETCYFDGSSG